MSTDKTVYSHWPFKTFQPQEKGDLNRSLLPYISVKKLDIELEQRKYYHRKRWRLIYQKIWNQLLQESFKFPIKRQKKHLAIVVLVTMLWMVTVSRWEWKKWILVTISSSEESVTKSSNRWRTSQSRHQRKPSATSVTNIDIATQHQWDVGDRFLTLKNYQYKRHRHTNMLKLCPSHQHNVVTNITALAYELKLFKSQTFFS